MMGHRWTSRGVKVLVAVGLGGAVFGAVNAVQASVAGGGSKPTKAPKSIVFRARWNGAQQIAQSGNHTFVLPGSWTQAAGDVDTIVGTITWTAGANCDNSGFDPETQVGILVNGQLEPGSGGDVSWLAVDTTGTTPLTSYPTVVFEPGVARNDVLSVSVNNGCATGNTPITVNSIAVDVIGAS